MSTDNPLVSIIAVCYNHESYVRQTLDSINSQSYKNIELLVVDACSTDNSVQVISEWINDTGSKCTFIKQGVRTNMCKNINDALKRASGKYYQVIACDDYFLHNKTKSQVEIFERLDMEYGLIYSDVNICDENGEIQEETFYDENGLRNPPSGQVYIDQAKNNFIKALTMMTRMDAAKEIGFYDEELAFEDVDFFLSLSAKFKFFYQNKSTGVWRRHSYNMTNQLYDNPIYLESRLKAYLKHINGPNVKVSEVLLPKIKRIVTVLRKMDVLIVEKVNLDVVKGKFGKIYWLMINGYVSYKVYFIYTSLKKFIVSLRYVFKTSSVDMNPRRF